MTESATSRRTAVAYAGLVGIATVAAAAALLARGPAPAVLPVFLLGALLCYSDNRPIFLPSGQLISPSFILIMAAIVVFRPDGAIAGPIIVSLFGGLYLPHLRERAWDKMLGNIGAYGLATLAATLLFDALPTSVLDEVGLLALASLACALVFFAVNTVIVAGYYACLERESLRDGLREMLRGHLQVYPFALLGAFLGKLYLDYGAVLVPLFIVPILVARETFAAYIDLKESQDAAVRTLIGALEAKDPYTAGHAERVARYAEYIGSELGMSPARQERLRFAALMHDVGKLVVPNHLLNKKGKLTAEEFAQVRLHEEVSVEILTRIDFLAPVAPSATSEAAEFAPVADDRGQPIEPHIVAVADAFDAMTSTRSYRRALPQQTAFDELRKNSGKQFHPRVVDALIVAIKQRGEEHGAGYEEVVHHEDAPEAGTGSAGLGDLMPELGGPAPAAGR
jgi:HD-GYP domain-containing protein (c-di-GMP phosphodiesterase class II)